MKKSLFILFLFLIVFTAVHSQEITSACILGKISDGTAPPPTAPKPKFIVLAEDVIFTTHPSQGGRTNSIRQVVLNDFRHGKVLKNRMT